MYDTVLLSILPSVLGEGRAAPGLCTALSHSAKAIQPPHDAREELPAADPTRRRPTAGMAAREQDLALPTINSLQFNKAGEGNVLSVPNCSADTKLSEQEPNPAAVQSLLLLEEP